MPSPLIAPPPPQVRLESLPNAACSAFRRAANICASDGPEYAEVVATAVGVVVTVEVVPVVVGDAAAAGAYALYGSVPIARLANQP